MEKLKKGVFSKFGLFDFIVNEFLTFIISNGGRNEEQQAAKDTLS